MESESPPTRLLPWQSTGAWGWGVGGWRSLQGVQTQGWAHPPGFHVEVPAQPEVLEGLVLAQDRDQSQQVCIEAWKEERRLWQGKERQLPGDRAAGERADSPLSERSRLLKALIPGICS